MKKAIIFGCGEIGTMAYHYFKTIYDIVAWADNNERLWGTKKENIEIIPPGSICHVIVEKNAELFVSVTKSDDIVAQLKSYGIKDFYVWREGFFFYHVDSGMQLRYTEQRKININKDEKNILFVMNNILGGIREYRLGKILKHAGYKIYLAYMMPIMEQLDDGFIDIYDDMIQIFSLQDLLELVNNNPFEFVHSSSEPEWGTGLILNSNKVVIHECHDLGSSNVYMSPEQMTLEYIANVFSRGVIYPSKKLRDDAIAKFGISKCKTLIMENTISESLIPKVKKEKISKLDGRIHAVYEGAISSGDVNDKRFFENIWLKLAEAGIHVHFYTNHGEVYCKKLESLHPNIHYEGNKSSKELAVEMSQYDVGLLLFNVNMRNRLYLEYASPNKLYEYINAGIPVATAGIDTYKNFVETNNIGKEIDFCENLVEQFMEIKKISVPVNFLKDNELTLESNENKIINYFINVKENCYE